jgi:hypothetical protein
LKGDKGRTFEIRHWFDGFTMNHRFEIHNGEVTYRSKKGATAREEYVKKVGVFPSGAFGLGLSGLSSYIQSSALQVLSGKRTPASPFLVGCSVSPE